MSFLMENFQNPLGTYQELRASTTGKRLLNYLCKRNENLCTHKNLHVFDAALFLISPI